MEESIKQKRLSFENGKKYLKALIWGNGNGRKPSTSKFVQKNPEDTVEENGTSSFNPTRNVKTSNKAEVKCKIEKQMEQLDLIFCVDCTSSMSSYIQAAQQNIKSIVQKLAQEESLDIMFGLISYRDHPPQDHTYVTKEFDFTCSLNEIQANVDSMSAHGGGDGPECVCCAYHSVLSYKFRPNSAKVMIHIADAPPHGLGESGDCFPNGCPDGHDPLEDAREMLKRGIVVYTVGCEPALQHYQFARDFMVSVAQITQGQAVTLSSASLLADVILNGAQEEVGLERIMDLVDEELTAAAQLHADCEEEFDEEVVKKEVFESLQRKGIRTKQMRTDQRINAAHADLITKSNNLSEWKEKAPVVEPIFSIAGRTYLVEPSVRASSRKCRARFAGKGSLSSSSYSSSSSLLKIDVLPDEGSEGYKNDKSIPEHAEVSAKSVSLCTDDISYEQVSRMVHRSWAKKAIH
mmetsp:Transcript_36700/g.46802  ORF Transcript_36700/g.46802 Transcript_36700/m.46802 type:complete len:463 (+) Transcript_36700:68-1456(+)